TSFLTPPVGFALFYMRGVAPSSISTMDIYRGVIPFVTMQIGALIILASFPSLATWLPKVVFPDPVPAIAGERGPATESETMFDQLLNQGSGGGSGGGGPTVDQLFNLPAFPYGGDGNQK
ncbi:MAG: TRAP transporter large permease subunit, partial [Acetobacteraceae bacterium]